MEDDANTLLFTNNIDTFSSDLDSDVEFLQATNEEWTQF